MEEYHKIQSLYKRDEKGKLIEGNYSLPEFDYLEDNQWVFEEKIDGCNIRIMWRDREVSFGGKTNNASIPAPFVMSLVKLFPRERMIEVFPDTDVCLYGEGFGAKIQKGGGKYRPDQSFVLFDVKINRWWLQREDVQNIADRLSIDKVPIVGMGKLYHMVKKVTDGFNSRWGNFLAEGIFARPTVELANRSGQRIITKLKYKDFNKESE